MNVLFKLNRNLIDIVDRIGLDYDLINNNIEILLDEVEYHVENEEELHILNDEELCEYLLNPTLCEGLIYTQRIYD